MSRINISGEWPNSVYLEVHVLRYAIPRTDWFLLVKAFLPRPIYFGKVASGTLEEVLAVEKRIVPQLEACIRLGWSPEWGDAPPWEFEPREESQCP